MTDPNQEDVPCIVCISNTPWNEAQPTNREQIMLRLSNHLRVLVVELPESLVGRILRRSVYHGRSGGLRRVRANLWIYRPIDPFPYPLTRKYTPLAYLNEAATLIGVRWAMARMRFRRPILWLYRPDGGQFLRRLGERRSIYHCVDDYEAMKQHARPGRNATSHGRFAESYLVRHANEVIVTSPHLLEKMLPLNARTILLPNVADTELFEQALSSACSAAPELIGLPRPVIGYVGALDSYKVNFPLIRYVVDRHPDWTFVFIGGVGVGNATSEEELPRAENIHYLGSRTQATLPSYVKAFDVAIIPYHLNSYTRGVFPLKFFEYLAAGKPVVSTPLPALNAYANIAHFADTPDAFMRFIELALAERDEISARARHDVAAHHSWDLRVREILALLSFETRVRA